MSHCSEHPRYLGKRKPRVPCEKCWRYYFYEKDKLANALASAGDRRDWDECDRLELEMECLKEEKGRRSLLVQHNSTRNRM